MDHNRKSCWLCGTANNLDVHHIHYKNLGHENLEDLSLLCRTCHTNYHAYKKGKKTVIQPKVKAPKKKKIKIKKIKPSSQSATGRWMNLTEPFCKT